ncbi:MAG: hypothetical protein JXC36_04675 [Candidatus Atribacteria bacterium]|nr:hypothetical protein [Candidatus Atribacteria bacterium]
MNTEDKECCPEFNPEKWDKKTFNWEDKQFIKETIPTFFHMPFPDNFQLEPNYKRIA